MVGTAFIGQILKTLLRCQFLCLRLYAPALFIDPPLPSFCFACKFYYTSSGDRIGVNAYELSYNMFCACET